MWGGADLWQGKRILFESNKGFARGNFLSSSLLPGSLCAAGGRPAPRGAGPRRGRRGGILTLSLQGSAGSHFLCPLQVGRRLQRDTSAAGTGGLCGRTRRL